MNGVTRLGLIGLLQREGLRLVERPFSVAEAKSAREAFLTSTTNFVLPVVSIDGTPVGNGHPGSITRRLRQAYRNLCRGAGRGIMSKAPSRPRALLFDWDNTLVDSWARSMRR